LTVSLLVESSQPKKPQKKKRFFQRIIGPISGSNTPNNNNRLEFHISDSASILEERRGREEERRTGLFTLQLHCLHNHKGIQILKENRKLVLFHECHRSPRRVPTPAPPAPPPPPPPHVLPLTRCAETKRISPSTFKRKYLHFSCSVLCHMKHFHY
jgi:hypothetical protein